MLERIRSLKPRIEHPVGKHNVATARSPQGLPNAKAVKLPKAIYNHAVEFPGTFPEPSNQAWRITVSAEARAEGGHAMRTGRHPWIVRRVKRNDGDLVSGQ